ncbi:hypothetical protein KUTeg_009108 [Tegillarca granosa]|uniref:IPT/TIG domain-containing protein n=1 Tax=Tegillarca granosa TaxID=220873 RepID=A0ABQ9FAE5_TEGGR|nr:hypothetical protein KUTeg_009108 [Tegillarca granosa]
MPTVIKENNVYNIELMSSNCGNNFPKFQIGSAQSTTATVIQDKTASTPVGGSFHLTFKGSSKVVNTAMTAKELKNLIEINFPDAGVVSVEREGNCANFNYTVTFLTRPGKQPKLQIRDMGLEVSDTGGLTGSNVSVSLVVLEHGRLMYQPITGDLLRTSHDKPQVAVNINGIPSICSGDCKFEWTQASTPTVTAISPTTEQHTSYPESVTITGTGFSSTLADNKVMMGTSSESECTVTAASSTSITCNLGRGSLGQHKVDVIIKDKGRAKHPTSGDVKFEFISGINSVAPSTVGLGGGVTLTLSGYGFHDNALVTIGGASCTIISITDQLVKCTLPPNTAGMKSVTLTQNGITLNAPTQVNYDASVTVKISSISPASTAVEGNIIYIGWRGEEGVDNIGGGTLVIQGSGFGSNGTLKIGDIEVATTTFGDTEVRAELPPLPPGNHQIKLFISPNGYAVLSSTNQLAEIEVILKLQNVFPRLGSVLGGTRLTLTGEGFTTNKNLIEVKVGEHICNVETAIQTQIVCLIEYTGKTHEINNTGRHYEFGESHAWNILKANVKVGDRVRWSWQYPTFVSGIAIRIEQTADESSTTYIGNGGFRSGTTGVKNGQYTHTFTRVGTYHYWSGFANDIGSLILRGIIEVEPWTSSIQNVTLKVAGYEATYVTNSGVADPTDNSNCPGVTKTCTDPNLTGNSNGRFSFSFLNCTTPNVTSINPRNGTTETSIHISGYNFHTTNCNNEITVDNALISVTDSNTTSLTCNVNPSTSLSIGVSHPVSIRINNYGYAVLDILGDINRTFGLKPMVSSLSPAAGSLGGKTSVTLTGSGFEGTMADSSVLIGGFPCEITSLTYTQIVCKTPSSVSTGVKIVQFTVKSISAEMCQNCNFEYKADVTPVISSVTPVTLTGENTELTITGTYLEQQGGGISGTSVKVGGESCYVTSTSPTEVICNITTVPCGTQKVELWVTGKGKATSGGSNDQITSQSIISSVTPSTGSIHGGTILQIDGNGFKQGQTTVTVGGKACNIEDLNLAQIKCKTPSNSAGTFNIAVSVQNCLNYPSKSFQYTMADTPVVSSINPQQASSGTSVTISGDKFSANSIDNKVMIGDITCAITSAGTNSLQCTLGAKVAGTYPIIVEVMGKGLSNSHVTFTYSMTATAVSPNSEVKYV